ncbi:MAG: SDR family oxidoreductase [Lewinellaceae bacterium]|nr:SDR family oxidoreductase [Lewinellaceae bacterium]
MLKEKPQPTLTTISILGAGWLGLPLGRELTEAGYFVKGSTTRTEKLPELTAAGIEGFLLRLEEDLPAKLSADWQAFLASEVLIITLPPGRRDAEMIIHYPRRIAAILEAARQAGQVKKILFTSSTSVYGEANGWVSEKTIPLPNTDSGKALLIAEQGLREQAKIEVTILRLAGLVGPGRPAGRFLAGRQDLPHGQQRVNMVHQDDCIGVIQAVIEQDAWRETFNVCADEHPTKASYYPHRAQLEGFEVPSFAHDEVQAEGKIVDNTYVKRKLTYTFRHPDPMTFPV